MMIIIFAAVIGVVMLSVKVKEFITFKNTLAITLTNRNMEKFVYYKKILLFYLLIIICSAVAIGVGIIDKDNITIAMGVVTFLIFLGEAINAPYKYTLYYNDSAFVGRGRAIRYKSIKEFNRISAMPFAFIKVITTNGDIYTVSPKSYDIIAEKYQNIKKK
ncbi:MAG: hypothetical protein ACK5G7_02915 [Erysipelotrichaceae bacterium]